MVPGDVTYLLDTYSTRHCGLPTAVRVMKEDPDRQCSVRFDSESTMKGDYMLGIELFREHGLEPTINLGGGFSFETTSRFESLRQSLGWKPQKQRYLYGQYLVQPHVPLPTRGDVGAVYKLSQTGNRATMKFSDNPAKSSLPGKPVLFRSPTADLIGQEGEQPPDGFLPLHGEPPTRCWYPPDAPPYSDTRLLVQQLQKSPPIISPATQALIDKCVEERRAVVQDAITREVDPHASE